MLGFQTEVSYLLRIIIFLRIAYGLGNLFNDIRGENIACTQDGHPDVPKTGRVIFFPINASGMGRFQLLNLGVLGYGLELRFWVVIAIIVSLTLTITLITTLTII